MEKRRLGSSDLYVSVFGMGCWQYGGGTYWGQQSQQDVDAVVHRALDLGVNYFDTAEVYNDGESEKSLGLALLGRRDRAIVGSKVNPRYTRPDLLRKQCEASLKRLQTDYIDLYMLHWPIMPLAIAHFSNDQDVIARPPSIQEAFLTLRELQQEGKIRHIGISNHGQQQMEEVKATGVSFVANELPYNLLSRAIEDELLPYCVKQDIGIIGYMGLQQGLLAGIYASLDDVKPMQARSRHFHHHRGLGARHGEEGAEQEITAALREIQELADELGVHIILLSLAWAIANKAIATTIVGSRNVQQLELNIQGAQFPINADVISRLNDITLPVLRKLGTNPDYYENRNNSRTC